MAKYVTNRKNAYRVVKVFKSTGQVKLTNSYGAEFKVSREKLNAQGYKFVSYRPKLFSKAGAL